MESLNDELEKPKTLLNDTCRMTHYTQEGVKQLLYQMESAKKLIIVINDRYPQCRKNQDLNVSIKKLEYAIKTTMKKVQDIREHIESNNGRQEALRGRAAGIGAQKSAPRFNAATATNVQRRGSFSNLLSPARKLHYILPNFLALKAHIAGTLTTPTTIP